MEYRRSFSCSEGYNRYPLILFRHSFTVKSLPWHGKCFLKVMERSQKINITRALGFLTLGTIAIGIFFNLDDIRRYVRITLM
jgi:hypothetical protein